MLIQSHSIVHGRRTGFVHMLNADNTVTCHPVTLRADDDLSAEAAEAAHLADPQPATKVVETLTAGQAADVRGG